MKDKGCGVGEDEAGGEVDCGGRDCWCWLPDDHNGIGSHLTCTGRTADYCKLFILLVQWGRSLPRIMIDQQYTSCFVFTPLSFHLFS